MKIVGIAACTSGIAHTYMAKKSLVKAGEELGHKIHIEIQGTIGTEDALTQSEIDEADVVIVAANIKVNGRERFIGKPIVDVPTNVVIKSPKGLINKIVKTYGG